MKTHNEGTKMKIQYTELMSNFSSKTNVRQKPKDTRNMLSQLLFYALKSAMQNITIVLFKWILRLSSYEGSDNQKKCLYYKMFQQHTKREKKTRNKIVCSNSLVRIYLFSSRILLLFLFNFAFTIHKCNMIFVVYKCVRNFLLADLIKHRSRSFLELKTRIELKMMIIRMILNIHTKNNVFIMVFG